MVEFVTHPPVVGYTTDQYGNIGRLSALGCEVAMIETPTGYSLEFLHPDTGEVLSAFSLGSVTGHDKQYRPVVTESTSAA